jgi:uncharacterized phiE125 gp8 family phage protein
MKRAIVVPAILAGAALDELKGWLAITTSKDDATLMALLRSALDMCEAFTGQVPLEALFEETLQASTEWQALTTRPVLAVTGVEAFIEGLQRTPLPTTQYAFELEADGSARIRILRVGEARRFAVHFTAGLAAEWAGLPEGLRHGVLRFAAHLYRQRDDARAAPPAAVAALWQPWRRMRLI